jgi:hypothetical protein
MNSFLTRNFGKDILLQGVNVVKAIQTMSPDEEYLFMSMGSELEVQEKVILRNMSVLALRALQGDSSRIYSVSKDFAKELAKVSVNISSEFLPKLSSSVLIDIPSGILPNGNGSFFTAAMVGTHKALGTYPVTLFSENPNNIQYVSPPAEPTMNLNEYTDSLIPVTGQTSEYVDHVKSAYKFVLNILVYLKSGDPDLRELKERFYSSGFKKGGKRIAPTAKDFSSTIIGFGFKKPNLRHAEESQVIGHFRWQPYGESRSKIKLIWIDPHVRTYEKDSN